MKKLAIASIMLMTFILSAQTAEWKKEIYKKAGTIEFTEPELFEHGTTENIAKSIIYFDVYDVIKLRGHICPGSLAGFLMTKKAMKKLYPDSLPVRGNMEIKASSPSGPVDIAVILTRSGEHALLTPKPHDFFDTSLKSNKGLVIVFKRKDTGKSVKATFEKPKVIASLGSEKAKEFSSLEFKTNAHKATKEEIVKFGKLVQEAVAKMLADDGNSAIAVE